jgi:hypothetical protein
LVYFKSSSEAPSGLVEIFIFKEFLAAEGVGISESWVNLNGFLESLHGLLVLFLLRVVVAQNNPGLRGGEILLQRPSGEHKQFSLFLQLPQTSGVVLKTL